MAPCHDLPCPAALRRASVARDSKRVAREFSWGGVELPAGGGASWSARLRLPSLVVLAVLLVVWEAVSRRYGAYVMPSPGAVIRGLAEIVATGEVWKHTGASLYRIAIGFGGAPWSPC